MTAWTSLGLGNVHAGEQDMRIMPKYPAAAGTQVGVLFCHSAGASAVEPFTPAQASWLMPLAALGHPILATDLGGPMTWGNDTAIARITEAKAYLHSAMGAKTGKIILACMSMGAAGGLAWAGANPSLVSAVIGVSPVGNITDIWTTNYTGWAATIDTCYSGGWSEATYGAAHNPATLAAAGKFSTIPMLLFSGISDPLVMPATVQYLADHAAPGSSRVAIVGQHTIPVPTQPILDFIVAHS